MIARYVFLIARYLFSISLGTTVTFALLFIMQLLIDTGREAITDSKYFRIADFVRVERNEVIETRQDKPERPPEPETPPEMPTPEQTASFDNAMAVSVSAPSLDANMSLQSVGFGVSDGEYLPIVKVAPIYPHRAVTMDLEGYVIVEFTVTRSGTTRDVVVIESTDSIFNRAAREAASKFKYKPRVRAVFEHRHLLPKDKILKCPLTAPDSKPIAYTHPEYRRIDLHRCQKRTV